MLSGEVDTARNVEEDASLLGEAGPVVDLELVERHAQAHTLEVAREVWLLWSFVLKLGSSPDGSARPAEYELQVLEPPECRGEHVQLGPVPPGHTPPTLGLHAHANVEVVAPEGPNSMWNSCSVHQHASLYLCLYVLNYIT